MKKQVMVINFDAVLSTDGSLRILEPGPGLNRVGYGIEGENRKLVKENIVEKLLDCFEHVYILSINKDTSSINLNFELGSRFISQYKQQLSFVTIDEMIKNKTNLKENSVIVPTLSQAGRLHPTDVEVLLRKNGIHLPVANSQGIFSIFSTKPTMAYVMQQKAPHLVPDQAIIDYDDPDSIDSALRLIKSTHVILKPIDGTRAKGVVLFPRDKLKTVINWLADADQFKALKMKQFTGQDKDLNDKLFQLDTDEVSSTYRCCIVQAYIEPKPVIIKQDNEEFAFRPTMRFVAIAVHDEQTKSTKIMLADVYNKLPQLPAKDKSYNWSSCISYSQLNRQLQWEDNPFMGLFQPLQTPKMIKNTPDFPTFVELSQIDRHLVEKEFARLAPVFHYLFQMNCHDLYDTLFSEKSVYSKLMKKLILIATEHPFSEDFCQVLLKHKINLPFLFVYTLHFTLQNQQDVSSNHSLIPPAFPNLLIKYQHAYGSREKNDLLTIQRYAKGLLKNESLMKLMPSNTGHEVITILKEYAAGNLEETPDEFYLQGINLFHQKRYLEASKLLEKAASKYPPQSLDLATCYYSLSSCYMRLERYKDAADKATACLSLRLELLPSDNPKLSQTKKKVFDAESLIDGEKLAQIALIQFKAEHYALAIDSFKKAIEKHISAQPESLRLATYYYNLSSSYHRDGQVDQAIHYANICLEIRKKLLGDDAAPTKTALDKITILEKDKITTSTATLEKPFG